MKFLIIGAGPTGLGAAYRLHEQGETDYLLVDQNSYFGGLATSFHDDKGYTWDFAVHVAHSHYHYVDDLMDNLLPDGFFHHERRSWVREYGTYIPYPFQNNIRHLPHQQLWECVEGILALQGPNQQDLSLKNFEDWILQIFGAGIAEHFMIPYNRKIWSIEPSEMGYQWTGDRVPKIELARILENIILEKDDVNWGPNATFQFPKSGGTGAIWKELGERLPRQNVKLSCKVEALDMEKKVAKFSDGTVEPFEHLISTMPLKVLADMIKVDSISTQTARLKHTHVEVYGVAPDCPIPEDLKEKTWLYCPEDNCIFYRVTPFSTFSPAHVPDIEKHCSFLCEISYPGEDPLGEADLSKNVLDSLRNSGIIDCDPATTHMYRMMAEYGYPVPTIDRDTILHNVLPELETMGIYSRGRFGGWKYEAANMDHSLMQGVEAIDHILNGADQDTIYRPNRVNAGKR